LNQILNIDKQNRLHPFWIFLSDITPGPKLWCSEDVFLIPFQLELALLKGVFRCDVYRWFNVIDGVQIFDAFKNKERKLRGHLLNFACDAPQWRKLTHMASHGAANCSDYRSYLGEKLTFTVRDKNGKDKEVTRFYYPPTKALNARVRTKEEVCFT
jgi:hypothetical protein